MTKENMTFEDENEENDGGMVLNLLADEPGEAEAAMILNAIVDQPEDLKDEADLMIKAVNTKKA
jgi:hypothetical protein